MAKKDPNQELGTTKVKLTKEERAARKAEKMERKRRKRQKMKECSYKILSLLFLTLIKYAVIRYFYDMLIIYIYMFRRLL